MSVSPVVSEVRTGLRQNATMTIAVVVTVAVSLALLGLGLLIGKQINVMKGYWYDKVEVAVYLTPDVTPAERDALNAELRADPLVSQVTYESQQDAYQRFKDQFKNSPGLVDEVNPDELPEAFRVKMTDPRQFAKISERFSGQPGVAEVQDQRELLKGFFKVLHGFQITALVIGIVQVLTALVLISNTIRVAAFSRRRETSVMRLVGASNLYIQLPFVIEGALAGLVGGALAIAAIVAVKIYVVDHRLAKSVVAFPFVGWGAIWGVGALVLAFGIVLSSSASFVTLRRHLRV